MMRERWYMEVTMITIWYSAASREDVRRCQEAQVNVTEQSSKDG